MKSKEIPRNRLYSGFGAFSYLKRVNAIIPVWNNHFSQICSQTLKFSHRISHKLGKPLHTALVRAFQGQCIGHSCKVTVGVPEDLRHVLYGRPGEPEIGAKGVAEIMQAHLGYLRMLPDQGRHLSRFFKKLPLVLHVFLAMGPSVIRIDEKESGILPCGVAV